MRRMWLMSLGMPRVTRRMRSRASLVTRSGGAPAAARPWSSMAPKSSGSDLNREALFSKESHAKPNADQIEAK